MKIKKHPLRGARNVYALSFKYYLVRFKWYNLSFLQHPRRILLLNRIYYKTKLKSTKYNKLR